MAGFDGAVSAIMGLSVGVGVVQFIVHAVVRLLCRSMGSVSFIFWG